MTKGRVAGGVLGAVGAGIGLYQLIAPEASVSDEERAALAEELGRSLTEETVVGTAGIEDELVRLQMKREQLMAAPPDLLERNVATIDALAGEFAQTRAGMGRPSDDEVMAALSIARARTLGLGGAQ